VLGAGVKRVGGEGVIQGVGGRFPRGGEIHLGDGGAPTRFMMAAACHAAGPVVIDGSPRMRQRPVAEGVELLRELGALVEYVDDEGRLPVRVSGWGNGQGPITDELEVARTLSSQFVTGLMLAAPFMPKGLAITFTDEITSASYLALTARVLADWGIKVEHESFGTRTTRKKKKGGPPRLRVAHATVKGRSYAIEADASSAVYWMVAAAICPGSRIEIAGVKTPSSQPDANVVGPLRLAGATIEASSERTIVSAPSGALHGIDVGAHSMPDAAVALAVLASRARRPSTIRGLGTLRVKESDRLAALATELGKLGCAVTVGDDQITIDPAGRHDDPVEIETYDDHRMAVAFGVRGVARGGISVRNPACVSKSYPAFWRDLARLYDGSSRG